MNVETSRASLVCAVAPAEIKNVTINAAMILISLVINCLVSIELAIYYSLTPFKTYNLQYWLHQKMLLCINSEPMGEFSYLTVENNASGLYKEKGSKFISYVFSVHSEEEVKSNLEQLRKKHHDTRHHCFAWVLGADKKQYRASAHVLDSLRINK